MIHINVPVLQRYFKEEFPLFDQSALFDMADFDIEKDPIMCNHKAVYNSIVDLCGEFNREGRVNDLFGVFLVSLFVTGADGVLSALQSEAEYYRSLFNLFQSIVYARERNIKIPDIAIHAGRSKVTNERLTGEFRSFVLDKVSMIFINNRWDIVSQVERLKVIREVEKYLEQTKPNRGQPIKKANIKKFCKCFDRYISETDTGTTARQRHLFLGKMCVLFGIFDSPVKEQLERGDEYFIKTFENQLPKK
jgi:hypothetical protein